MTHQQQIPFQFCFSTLLILLLLLALPTPGAAQKRYNRLFYKALVASDEKDYETAINLYREILEHSPDHVDALTQLGICLVSNNEPPDSALTLFYKALSIIPERDHFSDFGVDLQLTIARTYKLAEKPDSALAILTQLARKVSNRSLKKELQEEISQARNYAVLLNNPVPLEIKNLGHELNSKYDDHSPLVSFSGNRILFTSRRPSDKDRMLYDGQHAEKVYMSEFDGSNWKSPTLLADLSTRNKHESILSISPDYNQLFLFKNDKGNKSLYTSKRVNDKWTEPEKLPAPINSDWDETHACLSADRSTLFFTSTRPGGMGGLDIYMIKKNEFGKWGKPRNAGPNINSDKDEETPMLHPDGRTLYFSSEGHNTIGRFDIFYSQMLPDSTWTLPANMGYPINTPDDDFFFVPSLDKSRAYYASYRFKNSAGRSDLYEVEFDSTYVGSLAVVEGTIRNEFNLPTEQIRILVARNSDNQQVGDYRPDPATGKYMLFLESGHSYTLREATPYAITDSSILNISEKLAYDSIKQVLMVQDSRMIAPLKPKFRSNIDTRSLASITQKDKEEQKEEVPAEVMTLSEEGKIEEIVVLEDYQRKATSATKEEKPTETLAIVTPPEEIPEKKAPEAEVAKVTTPRATQRYTVQILALNKYPVAQKGYFEGLDKELIASYRGTDRYLRYVIRQFDSFAEAIAYRSEIQQSGRFSDAFIRQWSQLKALSIDSIPEGTPLEPAGRVNTTPEQEKAKESLKETNRTGEDSPEASQQDWKYIVQVLALNKYPMPQENYLEGLEQEKIDSLQGSDGFLRYFTREFNSLSEAIDYRNKIQESGRFSDAFIRRYSDLKKLSTETPREQDKQPGEKAKEKVKTEKAQPTAYKYTVQILALNKDPEPRESFFEGLDQKQITSYKGEDGYWRYIIRQFDTYAEAIAFQREIQESGRFMDAFIRRYSNLDELSTNEE